MDCLSVAASTMAGAAVVVGWIAISCIDLSIATAQGEVCHRKQIVTRCDDNGGTWLVILCACNNTPCHTLITASYCDATHCGGIVTYWRPRANNVSQVDPETCSMKSR